MRDNDVEALGRLVRLADVPSLSWLPKRDGRSVSVGTIYRWAAVGIRGVRLRVVRFGGTLATTPAWLMQFFEALADAPPAAAPTVRIPRQRRVAVEQAKRELQAAGI